MLLLRCTGKLRKAMALEEAGLYVGKAPASPLDTWYVNLLRISRRKCVLFTHGETLFSFLSFDASKPRLKHLDKVFREVLKEVMVQERFEPSAISQLQSGNEEVRYAKTDNRSVLGSMNDLASLYEHHILRGGGVDDCDIPATILKLNRVPFSRLGGSYAIEKFAGLLGVQRLVRIDELPVAPAGSGAVYQLLVNLRGSEPAVWRRLLVQDTTLDKLSDYLIAAMGWMGGHLHVFTAGGQHFSIPDPEWYGENLLDESTVKLSDIVSVKQSGFIYEYDLGDSWQHEVVVEHIGPPEPGRRYPICLEGALACPPEDVGGIGGFYEFLQAIGDRSHPEHKYLLEWAGGGYDPEAFDLIQTNRALQAATRGHI